MKPTASRGTDTERRYGADEGGREVADADADADGCWGGSECSEEAEMGGVVVVVVVVEGNERDAGEVEVGKEDGGPGDEGDGRAEWSVSSASPGSGGVVGGMFDCETEECMFERYSVVQRCVSE